MFQFAVPEWCVAIGIASHAEVIRVAVAILSMIVFMAICIYWRNRAREIRCHSEGIELEDIPELHRRERIRNVFAYATLGSLGVVAWTMHPMLVIVPAILGGSFLIDIRQVPFAYLLPTRKDR